MRTFIAIELPQEIKDKIYSMQSHLKELEIKASYPHKKNLEITLAFLGEKNKEEIELIKKQLSKIKFDNFVIKLNGVGSFPNIHKINTLWIGVESDHINNLVSLICKSIDFKLDKPFFPHITLCRIKDTKNIEKVKNFIKENKDIVIGDYKVEYFTFKESTLTKDGPIYKNLSNINLD